MECGITGSWQVLLGVDSWGQNPNCSWHLYLLLIADKGSQGSRAHKRLTVVIFNPIWQKTRKKEIQVDLAHPGFGVATYFWESFMVPHPTPNSNGGNLICQAADLSLVVPALFLGCTLSLMLCNPSPLKGTSCSGCKDSVQLDLRSVHSQGSLNSPPHRPMEGINESVRGSYASQLQRPCQGGPAGCGGVLHHLTLTLVSIIIFSLLLTGHKKLNLTFSKREKGLGNWFFIEEIYPSKCYKSTLQLFQLIRYTVQKSSVTQTRL